MVTFDRIGLVFLIVMTTLNLAVTLAKLAKGGKAAKDFMPKVFVVASVLYILFYVHLIGVVGK